MACAPATGLPVATQTATIGRLTIGPDIEHAAKLSNGIIIEPTFGLKGLWDFAHENPSDPASSKPFDARLESGAGLTLRSGIALRAATSLDGLLDQSRRPVTGRANVTMPIGH